MIIYYNPDDGKIFYAVRSRDKVFFSHTTNISLNTLEIDEIPENSGICIDLPKFLGRFDDNGLQKYYIDLDGDLAEREGWVERIEL